jgi:hypothetical protein
MRRLSASAWGAIALAALGAALAGLGAPYPIFVVVFVIGLAAAGMAVKEHLFGSRESLFSSDPRGDLLVEVLRHEWCDFQDVLVAVLQVRITNQTSWEKRARGIGWQGPFPRASSSSQERAALRGKPGLPRKVIEPKGSIQGWLARGFDRPDDEEVATPSYSLFITDELQHKYRIDVPIRGRLELPALELGDPSQSKSE